jgi:hypothetical protein
LGFSDNVVFRKQYHARTVSGDVRDLSTLQGSVVTSRANLRRGWDSLAISLEPLQQGATHVVGRRYSVLTSSGADSLNKGLIGECEMRTSWQ